MIFRDGQQSRSGGRTRAAGPRTWKSTRVRKRFDSDSTRMQGVIRTWRVFGVYVVFVAAELTQRTEL